MKCGNLNLLLMHTLANIRKNKRAAISLFFIIFLSALFLNLGLLVLGNFNKFFDRRSDELNVPHYTVLTPAESYKDSFEEEFKELKGVTATEVSDVIYVVKPLFQYNHADYTILTMFFNWDKQTLFTKHSLVGKALPESKNDIYLPYLFQISGGYRLGDDFTIKLKENSYTFRVAGFTEDIVYGSILGGGVGFYLPEKSYQRFITSMKIEVSEGKLVSARLADKKNADKIEEKLRSGELTPDMTKVWDTHYVIVKQTRTMTTNIGSMIIIGFAAFIVLLGIVVIHFRISNSIEDEMQNIGVMKAMGYTFLQVRLTLQLQFLCIAFLAGIVGVAFSYLGAGPLADMFAAQTGVIWEPKFDIVSSLESIVIIAGAVFFVTWISTRNIKKLPPVMALRNGIRTHSFRHNYFPLGTTLFGLVPALSLKTTIRNLRQNVMIFITVLLVTMLSVFSIVMFYNIALEGRAFLDMVGMEYNDVQVNFDPNEDITKLSKEINAMPEVEKSWYGEQDYDISIDKETAMALAIENPKLLDNNMVYDGRPPIYDNEISINGALAKKIKKAIGDTVTVKKNGKEMDYLITGFQNSASYLGKDSMMTAEGYQKLVPDYNFNDMSIYLKKGEDVKAFISKITDLYGSKLLFSANNHALMDAAMDVYVLICSMIAYLIMAVSVLVIILILYLLIHSMVLKQKKQFGIQKAMGYTNKQLRMQIALSILPVTFFASAIGCLISALSMNKLIAFLFKSIGVMKTNFIVPASWIIGLCMFTCAIAWLVAMLVSVKMKNISVYTLVTE